MNPARCKMPPKFITLGGKVEWGFQKIAAENAIRNLMGVKGVVNDVTVASLLSVSHVKRKIEHSSGMQPSRQRTS